LKTRHVFLWSLLAVALFTAITQFPNTGTCDQTVFPADRISIEQSQYSGQWKGNDLSVAYSYSKNQGKLDISGTVKFSYSLVMGYSILQDFSLGAVLLDENGKVLTRIGITTNRGPLDPITFRKSVSLPSGAAYIAFSYQGIVIENGHSGGKGTTSIWYSPVH
jgi:hypothetical protein